MQEKILTNKKNGMRVMLICIAVLLAALLGVIFGGVGLDAAEESGSSALGSTVLFVVSLIVLRRTRRSC